MLAPEQDLESRSVIWYSMQMLFMDTDPESELDSIASVCAESKYSLAELEDILLNEVQPSLRSNLLVVAAEWRGFEIKYLTEVVLKKHRYGKRRQLFFTGYSKTLWSQLSLLICEKRG